MSRLYQEKIMRAFQSTKVNQAIATLRNIVGQKAVADMSAEYGVRNLVSAADMLITWGRVINVLKGQDGAYANAIRAAIFNAFPVALNDKLTGESLAKIRGGLIPEELCSAKTKQLWEKAAAGFSYFHKQKIDNSATKVGGWTFAVEGTNLTISSSDQTMRKLKLQNFSNILKISERVIVVLEKDNEQYSIASNYGLIQRAISAVLADADFSGLEETLNYHSVIVKTAEGEYVAQKSPFFLNKEKELTTLGVCVKAAGFVPALSVDSYGSQGYVVKATDMVAYGSLFGTQFGAAIASKEGTKKLIARVAKQLREGRSGTATGAFKYAVVALDVAVSNRAVKSKEEIEAIDMLQASFGIGCAGGADSIMYAFGVHRAVGSNVLGQKCVVGRMSKVVHPEIIKAVESLASDVDVICGLGSVKAKAADLQWEAVEINGVEFYIAIVDDVDHTVTESAAALAYENTVEADHSVLGYAEQVAKRFFGESKTVWAKCLELVASSDKVTIVDAIKALEANGDIQPKRLKAKANLQMLESMAVQYGNAAVEEFLTAAFTIGANRSEEMIKTVLDLIHPSAIDASRINPEVVDLMTLKSEVEAALAECKVLPESLGAVVPAIVVLTLVSALGENLDTGATYEYVHVGYGDKTVLLPMSAIATAWEETSISGKVQVDGILAELLRAIVGLRPNHKGVYTDKALEYTFKKVITVRDGIAGKQLANIPFFGQAGLICSGWNVGYGEVVSATLQKQMSLAAKAYRCDVSELVVIWAKSPCIMYGAVRNVDVVWKGQSMTKEDYIIEGTAVYANALFVLEMQDDADGDKTSLYIVPAVAAMPSNPTPVDSANPVAFATKGFVADELKGLFVDFTKAAPELVIHTVDMLIDALYASLEAKGNVGLFTSYQQNVAALSVSFKKTAIAQLEAGNWMMPSVTRLIGRRAPVIGQVSEDFAQAFFATWHQLMGGVTQSDSMDRVKRDSSVQLKALADVLSIASLGKTNHVATEEAALAIAGKQKAFNGLAKDALIAAVNSAQDGKFAEQVTAAITLFSDYGISFHDTEIGVAFSAAGVPDYAINKLVFAFGMSVLREVGKIHNETFNLSALLFSNKDKIARYTDNLEGLKIRKELVLANGNTVTRHVEMNLQGEILALVKGL